MHSSHKAADEAPIRQCEAVELLSDVPAHDTEGFPFVLRAGDEGICVLVHGDGMVDVEFTDGLGDVLCVKTLPAARLRRA